jgi:hypothetical protein
MQFIIQLLNACKAETGAYPEDGGTNAGSYSRGLIAC